MDTTAEPTPSLGDSNARLIEFWESFDLDGRRLKLDQTGLEMATNQEQSVRSRRKLAEETKEFKKLATVDAKSKKMSPLLKSYQEEIDRLTRRARFAESGFLALYKSLYEAPDPLPHLRNLSSLKQQNTRLQYSLNQTKAELAETENELSLLKNQDITIRELEERIQELQETVNSQEGVYLESEKVGEQWLERLEKSQQALEQEKARSQVLEGKISSLEKEKEILGEQVFELRAAVEEKEAASQAEAELVEEAEQRDLSMLAELEQLKAELKRTKNNSQAAQQDSLLQQQLTKNNEELDQLRMELSQCKVDLHATKARHAQDKESHAHSISLLNSEIKRVQNELELSPSAAYVEKLEKELSEMKQDGFNGAVNTSDEARQEDLLTGLRVRLKSVEEKLETSEKKNIQQEEKLTDALALVNKLESELLQYNTIQQNASQQFINSNQQEPVSNNVMEQMTILRSALKDNQDEYQAEDSSMLTIVHEQRNRFRSRMLSLESEKDRLNHTIQRLKEKNTKIKQDNVKLYEKVQFLQNARYNTMHNSPMYRNKGGAGALEAAYQDMYEQQMSPFGEYSQRRGKRQLSKLSPVEKTTLKLFNFVFWHKNLRIFLFIYLLFLHFMVFVVLMGQTHSGYNPCKRGGDLGDLPLNVALHAAQEAEKNT